MEEFDLEPGEQVLRTVRTHWFVLAASLLPFALLAVLPQILFAAFEWIVQMGEGASPYPLPAVGPGLYRAVHGTWLLLLWTAAFNTFTQYYLNHWIVTTLRVVRVRQRAFFDREVSSFLLARVQDVETRVHGIVADLLGFGSVRVQTAGNDDDFSLDGIANPTGMRDLIMREIAALDDAPMQVVIAGPAPGAGTAGAGLVG
jgi:uncharacterized membrane protein YdbT with pleckstrin-like domain